MPLSVARQLSKPTGVQSRLITVLPCAPVNLWQHMRHIAVPSLPQSSEFSCNSGSRFTTANLVAVACCHTSNAAAQT